MKREKGFTLIELMTAIGIGAVLVSMAVPGLQSVAMNSKQRSGVNEIVAAMHLARNTAITTNNRVTLCTSDDEKTCGAVGWAEGWIAFTDIDSDQTVDANETIIRSGGAIDGLTIQSSQYSQYLMYRPSGRVMNASTAGNIGDFIFCDSRGSAHAKIVTIDLSGRPGFSETTSSGQSASCP